MKTLKMKLTVLAAAVAVNRNFTPRTKVPLLFILRAIPRDLSILKKTPLNSLARGLFSINAS